MVLVAVPVAPGCWFKARAESCPWGSCSELVLGRGRRQEGDKSLRILGSRYLDPTWSFGTGPDAKAAWLPPTG